MPEFVQEDLTPESTINVQFATTEDRIEFLKLLGESPTRQKSIWYPSQKYLTQSERSAPPTVVPPGKYPIYIISKGRWERPLTANALERLGIKYYLVVEPHQAENYKKAVKEHGQILTLPFSDLGQASIPARNWVWDHAVATGTDKHWILDDNIDGFYRLNRNLKRRVVDENPFAPVEKFCDRYSNIALAGMQYEFFATRRTKHPAFALNTRIYSCILIKNDIPYRWRGKYNEDTDLSLRVLKDGWCTVLFYAYLCKKMPTMVMEGGNTDMHKEGGRIAMVESLIEQHPDVVSMTEKWGRVQHHVNYGPFKGNKLQPLETDKGT
jgi:hypothetical protein